MGKMTIDPDGDSYLEPLGRNRRRKNMESGMQAAKMTRWERLWKRLGFGRCKAYWPEDIEGYAPAWLGCDVYATFDWKDRLRILISGRVMVSCAIKTDVGVTKSQVRTSISVMRPGDEPG